MNWMRLEDIEETKILIGLQEEFLVFDGCDYHIDYIDSCVETGGYFMANNTQPEYFAQITEPYRFEEE